MTTKITNIYQFKITLIGTNPPIWRRIQVPEEYSFWDLHVAIQDAMGWDDCHLHQFIIITPGTNERTLIGIPQDDFGSDLGIIPEWKTKMTKFFSLNHKTVTYEYDFGDSWEHRVTLEKILLAEQGIKYPICIAGRRACPPEDCGGVWGYEEILDNLNNPNREEHEELIDWVGRDFDPTFFDPKLVRFENPKKRLKTVLGNL